MTRYPKAVSYWLIIGLIMVFFQVVIGGVTRLTGSGLSITRWEIVTGTLPPLNADQWDEAFELYKETPQYEKINEGMDMSSFQFIYFWEYFHRLWARLMGFVFLIPLFIFWRKGWIDRYLGKRLAVIFFLAALAASFGWIMVASGLIERPWVNAYKLTLHLGIALSLVAYLFWTILRVTYPRPLAGTNHLPFRGVAWFGGILIIQLLLGGVMSGMKAALFYPTWPDMNGMIIPEVLRDAGAYRWSQLVNYDEGGFAVALIQFLHRSTAYILVLLGIALSGILLRKSLSRPLYLGTIVWLVLLFVQVGLGIATVLNSQATIPVDLGVYHQAGALLLMMATLFIGYHGKGEPIEAPFTLENTKQVPAEV
jgi:cytochrome c oxidase assembly protein subunit 15